MLAAPRRRDAWLWPSGGFSSYGGGSVPVVAGAAALARRAPDPVRARCSIFRGPSVQRASRRSTFARRLKVRVERRQFYLRESVAWEAVCRGFGGAAMPHYATALRILHCTRARSAYVRPRRPCLHLPVGLGPLPSAAGRFVFAHRDKPARAMACCRQNRGETMLATRLHAIGDLRLERCRCPSPARARCWSASRPPGICGTDRHLFKGEFPSSPAGDARPRVLRHRRRPRRRRRRCPRARCVTCDPNDWCGTCDACRRGRVNLCAAQRRHRHPPRRRLRRVRRLPGAQGGGAAGGPRPAARRLLRAARLHAARRSTSARPGAGERVLVIGGGVIGLLALQLAGLAGAETMLLTRHPAKRALRPQPRRRRPRPRDPAGGARALARGRRPHARMRRRRRDRGRGAASLTRGGGRVVVLGVLPQGETGADRALRPAVPRDPAALLLHQPLHPDPRRRADRQRQDRRRAADLAHHPARRGGARRSPTRPGRAR